MWPSYRNALSLGTRQSFITFLKTKPTVFLKGYVLKYAPPSDMSFGGIPFDITYEQLEDLGAFKIEKTEFACIKYGYSLESELIGSDSKRYILDIQFFPERIGTIQDDQILMQECDEFLEEVLGKPIYKEKPSQGYTAHYPFDPRDHTNRYSMTLYPKDKDLHEEGAWLAYVNFDIVKQNFQKIRNIVKQLPYTNVFWKVSADADHKRLLNNPSEHMP